MTSELKQTIDIIRKEFPNYSEDDIKEAIISHIESSLPEIILKLKLPPKESPIHSLTERLRHARSGVRDFRLSEKNSKHQFLSELDNIREKLLESGETQNANTIAQDIQSIDSASTTLEAHLLTADAHISTFIEKQSTTDKKSSENLKKLEWISNDD